MRNIVPEFREMFDGTDDDAHLMPEEGEHVPDKFLKVLADCEFGINSDALAQQTAGFHARIDKIYTDLAQTVAPKAPADPQALAKRFSQPDPKSVYKQFFREQIALGKSAGEVLNAWLAEFEHRSPSVEKLMREVAVECEQ